MICFNYATYIYPIDQLHGPQALLRSCKIRLIINRFFFVPGCEPITWTPRQTKSDPAPPLPVSIVQAAANAAAIAADSFDDFESLAGLEPGKYVNLAFFFERSNFGKNVFLPSFGLCYLISW